jgi:hypothetical protein
MKSSVKIMPRVCCALVLAFACLAGVTKTAAVELKEYNYYYDGAKWTESWFQCETGKHVALFTSNNALRYFPKSQPSQVTSLSIKTEEPDCGMMKCYFNFTTDGGGKGVVMESNYRDDEAYWTAGHVLTLNSGAQAIANEEECKWFERTRLAVVTDRRTIYVTEGRANQFEYRSFNFDASSRTPSVDIKRGSRSLDISRGMETFTFMKGGYSYVLNVSAVKRPFVEVIVKKNGAVVQKENCLSYTYLKKV